MPGDAPLQSQGQSPGGKLLTNTAQHQAFPLSSLDCLSSDPPAWQPNLPPAAKVIVSSTILYDTEDGHGEATTHRIYPHLQALTFIFYLDAGQKEWIPIKSDISALIRWEDHLVGEKVLSIRVYDETNCGPPLTLGGYSKWLWKV
ncbi:hypothetical protein MG293_002170 [Ovis ammon polii]|uniref:Uncharacterized protein n=1 Tax=Ovis ammon polii TaxID=230172 RepID=A0AAD4URX0_OVIAM|nr:hypothetical protein MG293_002170 [Ovis ammon polii]